MKVQLKARLMTCPLSSPLIDITANINIVHVDSREHGWETPVWGEFGRRAINPSTNKL